MSKPPHRLYIHSYNTYLPCLWSKKHSPLSLQHDDRDDFFPHVVSSVPTWRTWVTTVITHRHPVRPQATPNLSTPLSVPSLLGREEGFLAPNLGQSNKHGLEGKKPICCNAVAAQVSEREEQREEEGRTDMECKSLCSLSSSALLSLWLCSSLAPRPPPCVSKAPCG